MRFLPILVVVLALVGCGSAPSPEQAVSDTGAKTADAGTARIAVGFDGVVETNAAFNLEDGTGVLGGDRPHTIIAADASYERLSDELTYSSILSSKRWLKFGKGAWRPAFVLDPIVRSPADLLAFLSFAGEVHEVGSGEERGEPVTRYSAVLDFERFLAGIPPAERADFRDVLSEIWPGWAAAAPSAQLALDAEGRLRRADLVLGDGSGELAFEFFDYGVKVDVTAPPKDEVVTWAEYEELLRKECEALEKKGLEKTKPHCVGGCSAGEGEALETQT